MPIHVVRQGEHVARVAKQHGFRDFHTVWDRPENQDLRQLRDNPNVLLPGDQLFIPERETKEEQRATGNAHTFQVLWTTVTLRIVVRDFDNVPVANTPCQLEVEGTTYDLTSDADGKIEQEVPASAEEGYIRIIDLDFERPLKIGHLDPLEEESGWTARLMNLGYLHSQEGDTYVEDLRSAVEEFQCDYSLPLTGEMDDATKAKLEELYGC